MPIIEKEFGSSGKNFSANKGGTDNWYTPEEAIIPLLSYIPKGSKIWCPFDLKSSNYVKILGKDNLVFWSCIETGQDFFAMPIPKPGEYDFIISNPPYSKRTEIIQRLYEFDIPFAMMCNSNGIFDNKKRWICARDKGVELLFMSPRAKYSNDLESKIFSSPPYQSCYWCYKMLPERLVFTDIT